MTSLDQALQSLHDDPENMDCRHHFYSLFLQTDFHVPIFDEQNGGMARLNQETARPEKALPLIMESEGNNYMMLFDQAERVTSWAEMEVHCLTVPGYVAIAMATEDLHLAMNIDTDHSKLFIPEEISWLKQVVEQSTGAGDA